MTHRFARLFAIATLVCCVESAAFAQEAPVPDMDSPDAGAESEARIHFNLAMRYYETGRFAEAALEFKAAYELTRLSELLYNAFLAYREAGDYDAAIRALEEFIPNVEDEGRRRGYAARLARVRELRERVAEQGQEPPRPSEEPPEELAPVSDTSALDTPPEQTPPSAPSPAPWILAGAGGAIVIAGAVTGVLALSANSDLDEMCESGTCRAGYESVQDRGRSLALTTDILIVGGAVIAATGLLWGLLRSPDDDQEDEIPVSAQASCGAGGCTATLSGTF